MPEYRILKGMIQRCYNPKCGGYRWYGGRGISVSDAWRGPDGFERFMEHVGPRPSASHEIDRIDNDRGYEPGNVRWVTQTENKRNKRNNRRYEFRGERLTLGEIGERVGVDQSLLAGRMNHCGWDIERAVAEPRGIPAPEVMRRSAYRELYTQTGSLYSGEFGETIGRAIGEDLADMFGPPRDWPAQGCDDVVFSPDLGAC